MMERIVLDKLEARRMAFVGTCWSCGWMEKNMLEKYLTLRMMMMKKKKKKKKTYHPPSSLIPIPIPIPIPTNQPPHRKNSIQHHNPH